MLNVLDKRWLSMGWRAMDPKDSEVMALVWIEILDRERVPYQHYEELYRRCVGLRARRLSQGLKCDDFSVEMMIACWPSLAAEIRERMVKEGRYLEQNAAAGCEKCYGTGMEVVPGKGARVCKHGNGDAVA